MVLLQDEDAAEGEVLTVEQKGSDCSQGNMS